MQRGGVGYYPTAHTPFVHLDVGSVRAWPRMTRSQLARLFPDGRTVHLPADGKPMEGYEIARAEILARGGSVLGYASVADADEAVPTRRRSLWATLFGGDDEGDDDIAEARAPRGRTRPPATTRVAAAAPPSSGNSANADMYATLIEPAPAPAPTRAASPVRPVPVAAPAPETRVAALARPEPAPEPKAPEEPPAVAAPLPAPRPPEFTQPVKVAAIPEAGPRMVWQQGAGALSAPASVAGVKETLVDVSVPPRRPGESAPQASVAQLAYADVPAPPVRPASMAGVVTSSAGLLRGTASVGEPPGRAAPVPPNRGGAAQGVTVASASEPVVPRLAPGETVTRIASTAPATKPAPAAANDERAALRALFANAAMPAPVADRSAPVRVAAARVKDQSAAQAGLVADRGAGLALGFTQSPSGDLAPGRFSGPAVKPLPVRR
jgi:hypothetical protein